MELNLFIFQDSWNDFDENCLISCRFPSEHHDASFVSSAIVSMQTVL